MSTVKRNHISKRFLDLAILGEEIFHAQDLANLWEISDKNTLHTTLKRYTQKGLLHRIYRGLYTIKPISEINPWELGLKIMHGYAYIGAETVLFQEGIINQSPNAITIISNKSKRIIVGQNNYHFRKLHDMYLYNPDGILIKNKFMISTVERAIADMLYFNPLIYFDNNKLINWAKVKRIQKSLGYPPTPKRHAAS
jgi:predicted transcriptional regulator of viral defense system